MIFSKTIQSGWMRSAAIAIWMLFPAADANSEPGADFSKVAWQAIQDTYGEIVHHPFNVELRSGSLDRDKFRFYEEQDAFYLEKYSQVLRVLARRMSDSDHRKVVNRLADDCAKETTFEKTPKLTRVSPAALAYSNFLLSLSVYGSTEEIAAAVLPCYWIYLVLGKEMQSDAKSTHPYFKWISTYSSTQYARDVAALIQIVNSIAKNADSKTREKMLVAFQVSARYELHFWDDAFRKKVFLGSVAP